MRNKIAGYVLGVLELVALLQAYKLWLAPFTTATTDGFTQIVQLVTEAISVILVILPVAGMFLIHREKRLGFVLLAAFPLFCIFFGITAFPIISFFYGVHLKFNSLLTAFTNALVCAAAFWLFVSARSNFKVRSSSEMTETSER